MPIDSREKGHKDDPAYLMYNFMRGRLFAEFRVGMFYKNCAAPYSEVFYRDNRYPSLKYRCSCTHRLPPSCWRIRNGSGGKVRGKGDRENSSGKVEEVV